VPRSRPLLLMCSLPAVLLAASRPTSADADAATTIVAAERAFAAQVRSAGVREGFLAWLAPTSVVFRPSPVSGIKTYEKQKPGWNGLLAWTPVHAAISADGKLGWSTGPWTWSRDSTQKKPDAHGDYMSVWRKQSDGSWKAVLDCGVGHPAPTRETPAVTYSAPVPGANLGSKPLATRQSLYQADAGFAKLAGSTGVSDAIARYGTDDIIVLREGEQRVTGRAAARDSIGSREATARMVSNAQSVAGSGDMGYTYGTFVTGGLANPDSAWYVHVWHRGAAASWKLACQVVMPVSRQKK
jgi:ketosteroid isomerase-like protein